MARRRGLLFGLRYCGNTHTMEVHDLDNEQTQCQIDEIIEADLAMPFNKLCDANGYADCPHCLDVLARLDKSHI